MSEEMEVDENHVFIMYGSHLLLETKHLGKFHENSRL